jgi:hypothetical protein
MFSDVVYVVHVVCLSCGHVPYHCLSLDMIYVVRSAVGSSFDCSTYQKTGQPEINPCTMSRSESETTRLVA